MEQSRVDTGRPTPSTALSPTVSHNDCLLEVDWIRFILSMNQLSGQGRALCVGFALRSPCWCSGVPYHQKHVRQVK